MALTIPAYIASVKESQDTGISQWDLRTAEKFYLKINEKLRHNIHVISEKGVFALSLGFEEWVAWLSNDKLIPTVMLPAVEAIWAGSIDWRYLSQTNKPSWDGWTGPALGPAAAARRLMADVIRLTRSDQFASPEAVSLSRLVEYILPNPEPFKEWRREIIKRLAATHSDDDEAIRDQPVPREALDPEFDYRPEKAPELLAQFLAKLDYRKNPYLATPQQMKKAGFKGTPYVYKASGSAKS